MTPKQPNAAGAGETDREDAVSEPGLVAAGGGAPDEIRPTQPEPSPALRLDAPHDGDPEVTAPAVPRVASQPSLPERLSAVSAANKARVDPYPGSVLQGRYRIQRKIGEGGMGAVYLAVHEVIERKVAIKILSQDFARKPELIQRFLQEARAAARIGHENIVEVTDFGETDSHTVFFVMEYLEGQDLGQAMRACAPGTLPIPRVRHIALQICKALSAAHQKGIIHRDLKPENIFLLEKEGKSDFVKVLDFGIAKISNIEDDKSRLTRTGMIFGTPEYMSPEQARGDAPDHRVDVYALGCMIYEMLTGCVPFEADTFMGVLTKHMFEPVEPPSRRLGSPLPREIEEICLRALEKDRDRRFQSMQSLAQALEGEVAAYSSGVVASPVYGGNSSHSYRPNLSGNPGPGGNPGSGGEIPGVGMPPMHSGPVPAGMMPGPGMMPAPGMMMSPGMVPSNPSGVAYGAMPGPGHYPGMVPAGVNITQSGSFGPRDETTQSAVHLPEAQRRRGLAIVVGLAVGALVLGGLLLRTRLRGPDVPSPQDSVQVTSSPPLTATPTPPTPRPIPPQPTAVPPGPTAVPPGPTLTAPPPGPAPTGPTLTPPAPRPESTSAPTPPTPTAPPTRGKGKSHKTSAPAAPVVSPPREPDRKEEPPRIRPQTGPNALRNPFDKLP